VRALDQTAMIQRAGALAIMGGLRTSATDSLNAYAHILPSVLMVSKWCHRALIRLAVLPKEHLLYRYINHQGISKIKRHAGPLNHLLKWFKLNVGAIEKIPSAVRDPMKLGKIPLKISIAKCREDSIKETENATETIQIFSDSSSLEGKVGAAAVLFAKGKHIWTLHYHLSQNL